MTLPRITEAGAAHFPKAGERFGVILPGASRGVLGRRERCSESSSRARRRGEGAKIKWQIVYDAWVEELVGDRNAWKGMLGSRDRLSQGTRRFKADAKIEERRAMNPHLSIPRDQLTAFCQEHGIRRLAIFGSALREDFGPDSDVDVLVEFEPDRIPGLLGVAGMEIELSDVFGRDVDLVTRSEVEDSRNYIRRKSILESAEVVYGT